MTITIKKIAELANVSRGTVDRALNGRGGVSKDVEEKILNIANEYGYKPNIVAKSLAIKSQNLSIGVVISSIGNKFFDEVLRGIENAKEEIKDFGISVITKELKGYNINEQLNAIETLVEQGVSAIAITPINDEKIRNKLYQLTNEGIKIIALNIDIEGKHNVGYVGCDYFKSGQTAAAMMGLFCKGVGNTLIVTGSKQIYGHNRRIKGFQNVIAKEYPKINIIDIVENNDNDDLSFELVKKSLKKDEKINSIYFAAAGTDGGIKAAMKAADNQHKKYKIITNDATQNRIKDIKLGVIDATICQQPYEQGYISIKKLFDCIMLNEEMNGQKIYTNIGIKIKYNFS